MTRKRFTHRAGLVAAALCLPILAGTAHADRGDRDRGNHRRDQPRQQRDHDHDRSKGYQRQHNRPKVGFGFNFSIGNAGRKPNCGGYWKRVYCPPVYRIRYDSCGRAYRSCVTPGTWKTVWVSFVVR